MSSQRYQDQTRTCVDCGREFVWKAGEQEFFHEKGFADPPKRCKPCKQAKNQRMGGDSDRTGAAAASTGASTAPREMTMGEGAGRGDRAAHFEERARR